MVGGGALALSVTFASAITGTDPINIWKLGSAWIALVTSVAFVALSYIPSIRSHWLVLSNRDAGWWATAATGLSVGSGLLLAVGLGMLGWFAIDNMTGVVT